jgi:hypothetical protein
MQGNWELKVWWRRGLHKEEWKKYLLEAQTPFELRS